MSPNDVLLSPRVVDQRSFDDLAGTLRSLIDNAGVAADTLRGLIATSGDGDAQAGKSTVLLQERLSLGAKMLKAFQAQITRVEASIAQMQSSEQQSQSACRELEQKAGAITRAAQQSLDELQHKHTAGVAETDARIQARLAAIDAMAVGIASKLQADCDAAALRIDRQFAERAQAAENRMHETGQSIERRIAAVADAAIERFESHVARRQADLATLDQQISDALPHANAILDAVESAEVTISAVMNKHSEMAVKLESRLAEAREIIRQCAEARQLLGDDLVAGASEIDRLSSGLTEVRDAMQEKLYQCGAAERELRDRIIDLKQASSVFDSASATAEELRGVLHRLEPWERAVFRSDGAAEGLPEPVARLFDELRQGLSENMRWLSATMRDMAQRVEQCSMLNETDQAGSALPRHRRSAGELEGSVEIVANIDHQRPIIESDVAMRFQPRAETA